MGGRLALNLSRPSPNPFAGRTSVQFDVPDHTGPVRLAVYGVDGRLVRELAGGALARGRHVVSWDGTDSRGDSVASGVYFLRLEARGETQVRKALVLR
jgi:flagellar hook assembly protein FlgD